jgi:hypothetical protein
VHVGYARYLAMAGCAVISSMLSSAILHSSIHIRCFRPDLAAKKIAQQRELPGDGGNG